MVFDNLQGLLLWKLTCHLRNKVLWVNLHVWKCVVVCIFLYGGCWDLCTTNCKVVDELSVCKINDNQPMAWGCGVVGYVMFTFQMSGLAGNRRSDAALAARCLVPTVAERRTEKLGVRVWGPAPHERSVFKVPELRAEMKWKKNSFTLLSYASLFTLRFSIYCTRIVGS